MFSLKRRWDNLRNADGARSKLVRSNSFTLQLNPSYFENGPTSNNYSSSCSSESSPELEHRPPKHQGIRSRCRSLSGHTKRAFTTVCHTTTSPEHSHTHKVRYIFDTTVSQRPTSLKALQEPLNEVYLKYMTRNSSSVPGILEILPQGLKVQYAKCDGTDYVEMFNPFHTIAYWAAVQCVVKSHRTDEDDGKCDFRFRFVPFAENGQPPSILRGSLESVADTSSIDSMSSLEDQADGRATSTKPILEGDAHEHHVNFLHIEHPPLFACVMRQNGVSRILKCHVFLCSTVQQAIFLASQLYEMVRNNACSLPSRQTPSETRMTATFKAIKQKLNETKQQDQHYSDSGIGTPSVRSRDKGAFSLKVNGKRKKLITEAKVCTLCNRIKDPTTTSHRCGSVSHVMLGLHHLSIKEMTNGQSRKHQHKTKPSYQSSLRSCSSNAQNEYCTFTMPTTKSAVISKTSERPKSEIHLLKGIRNQFKLSRKKSKGDSDVPYYTLQPYTSFTKSTTRPSSTRSQWMRLLKEDDINDKIKICAKHDDATTSPYGDIQKRRQELEGHSSSVYSCKLYESAGNSQEHVKSPARRRKKCKHHEPNASKRLCSVRCSKNERHSVNIQGTRHRCKKRTHQCKHGHIRASSLMNTVGMDEKEDRAQTSPEHHEAPLRSIRRQELIGPVKLCPHIANPQLDFQKIILPKSSGLSLWGKVLNQKRVSKSAKKSQDRESRSIQNTRRGDGERERKRDQAAMKKDAEIVSVLEQIRHGGNTTLKGTYSVVDNQDNPSSTVNSQSTEPENINSSDPWGCATFLP